MTWPADQWWERDFLGLIPNIDWSKDCITNWIKCHDPFLGQWVWVQKSIGPTLAPISFSTNVVQSFVMSKDHSFKVVWSVEADNIQVICCLKYCKNRSKAANVYRRSRSLILRRLVKTLQKINRMAAIRVKEKWTTSKHPKCSGRRETSIICMRENMLRMCIVQPRWTGSTTRANCACWLAKHGQTVDWSRNGQNLQGLQRALWNVPPRQPAYLSGCP